MNPVRVLVVDDQPLYRSGVVAWLNQQPGLSACGEVGTAAEARNAIATLRPDLVLLDLHLRDSDGLDFGGELCAHYPGLRIIIVSEGDEATYAHRALRAGARGYVMKSEGTDVLLTAIQRVLAGDIHVSASVMLRLTQRLFPDPAATAPDLARLSDRELQVFQMLGAGHSIDEIAESIHRSRKTVESHRENLKRKLGLRTSKALVRTATLWAEKRHLVAA